MSLTASQQLRYGRQAILDGVGYEGQEKLAAAKILVIGVGGLGCPASLYLAAAGVGKLGLIDPDVVSESNLHRQILYGTNDIGRPKVEVAKQKLMEINPDIEVEIYQEAFTAENALSILGSYDLVLDGTDNFATRYLVNDASVLAKKINIYGSILRFEGQVSVFADKSGPCYRCLFPNPPEPGSIPNCAEAGVIGTLPAIIGSTQANEAIKWILGIGESLVSSLLLYDALSADWNKLTIEKNPACPICSSAPTITELREEAIYCTSAVVDLKAVTVSEFLDWQASKSLCILDVRTEAETRLGQINNAISIPLNVLSDRIDELSHLKHQRLVVTCQKGPRAEKAVSILRSEGFEKLYVLTGGMEAYLAA